MAIPQGVTPTFVLTFSDETLDLTQAAHVYVTFRGGEKITKSDGELTIEAKSVSVYLTQAETLSFQKGLLQIQVNWTYPNGTRSASTIGIYDLSENLLDKVVE